MSGAKYFIIQSNRNDKYLHLDTENPNVRNALRFAGDYSFGLETRFEMEPATTPGFVHIRSMRNNKYWANSGGPHNLVTAMADKPEEVKSNPHCTLFEIVGDSQLRHVSTGQFVTSLDGDGHYGNFLYLAGKDEDSEKCLFIDWESILVMPKVVRITGRQGNHLKAWEDGFMDFQYHSDDDDPSLYDYEVHPSRNGGVRLKSVHFRKYWTIVMTHRPWILLRDASETVHDISTIFLPKMTAGEHHSEKKTDGEHQSEKADGENEEKGNYFLMKSLMYNTYCTRMDALGKQACLAALRFYPDKWCIFKFEEPVVSRKITDVIYHLNNARIYGENVIAVVSQEVRNRTQAPNKIEMDFRRKENRTTNWNAGVSLSVKTTGSYSVGVPKVASGEVKIEHGLAAEYKWGEINSEDVEIGDVQTVDVPAMSGRKVTLRATQAMCDVPFSYTQHDVMKDGTTRSVQKDDGLFTGVNSHSIKYDNKPFSL